MYGSFFDALFQNQPLIQIICDENGDDDNDVDGVGGGIEMNLMLLSYLFVFTIHQFLVECLLFSLSLSFPSS